MASTVSQTPTTATSSGTRIPRARAQWDNWLKDLRTEQYRLIYEQSIYPSNLYLDRTPYKHDEFRREVTDKQVKRMHELGVWTEPEREEMEG